MPRSSSGRDLNLDQRLSRRLLHKASTILLPSFDLVIISTSDVDVIVAAVEPASNQSR